MFEVTNSREELFFYRITQVQDSQKYQYPLIGGLKIQSRRRAIVNTLAGARARNGRLDLRYCHVRIVDGPEISRHDDSQFRKGQGSQSPAIAWPTQPQ